MGVKSTVTLTRQDAMQRLVELKLEDLRLMFEAQVQTMSNTEIEDELETTNDRVKGGEGFENYMISDGY
jgi:ribosomal protein L29